MSAQGTNFLRCWTTIGPTFGQVRRNGPISAKFAPILSNFDLASPTWDHIGQFRPTFGQSWPMWAKICQHVVNFGELLAKLGQAMLVYFVQVWSHFAELGQFGLTSIPLPNFGSRSNCSASVGQLLEDLGARRVRRFPARVSSKCSATLGWLCSLCHRGLDRPPASQVWSAVLGRSSPPPPPLRCQGACLVQTCHVAEFPGARPYLSVSTRLDEPTRTTVDERRRVVAFAAFCWRVS